MILCITVIIPIYNASSFIEKAVNSCLQFPEVKEILDNCFVDVCKPTIEECVMLDLTHGDGNAKVWCSMLRELKSNKQSFLLPADETFKGSYTRAFIDDYIKIPEGY